MSVSASEYRRSWLFYRWIARNFCAIRADFRLLVCFLRGRRPSLRFFSAERIGFCRSESAWAISPLVTTLPGWRLHGLLQGLTLGLIQGSWSVRLSAVAKILCWWGRYLVVPSKSALVTCTFINGIFYHLNNVLFSIPLQCTFECTLKCTLIFSCALRNVPWLNVPWTMYPNAMYPDVKWPD